jgi:hypothetical protein
VIPNAASHGRPSNYSLSWTADVIRGYEQGTLFMWRRAAAIQWAGTCGIRCRSSSHVAESTHLIEPREGVKG